MTKLLPVCALTFLLSAAAFAYTNPCAGYTGWTEQTNPPTDPTGFSNTNFPEGSSTTYFSTQVTGQRALY